MSAEITEADRETAEDIEANDLDGAGNWVPLADRIAAALAAEREKARHYAAGVLRAAAAEQRNEADQVPWDDEGTHADGHRCAADFLDRRAAALEADQ